MEKAGRTTRTSTSSNAHLRKVARAVEGKIRDSRQTLQQQADRAHARVRVKETSLRLLREVELELPEPQRSRVRAKRLQLHNDLKGSEQNLRDIAALKEQVGQVYHEIISLFHDEILEILRAGKARDGGVYQPPPKDEEGGCGYRCIARKPGEGPKRQQDHHTLPMSLWDT